LDRFDAAATITFSKRDVIGAATLNIHLKEASACSANSRDGLLFKFANYPITKLLKTIMSEINQLSNDGHTKHLF